ANLSTPKDSIPFVTAFLVLQLSGATIFAFVVLSACIFREAKRHPIWFSFCISWIAFGLSYSLLLLTGQQFKKPARVPCTIQSSLIYAAPFLVMGSSLGLVVHLLLNVLSALSRSPKIKQHLTIMQTLVVLPWMVWVAIFVGVLVFGFSHNDQVAMSRNGTYCVIQDSSMFVLFIYSSGYFIDKLIETRYDPRPKVTAVSTTIASTAIIAVEFAIGIHLYRCRGIVNIFSQAMAMAIRILIFTILGFGALWLRNINLFHHRIGSLERMAILEATHPCGNGSDIVDIDHRELHHLPGPAVDKTGIHYIEETFPSSLNASSPKTT
ncbi:hypothetical protein CVT25_001132, partial [Psilocybe cyanescens]